MEKPVQNLFDLHCDTLYQCHRRALGLNSGKLQISLDKLPPGYRLCQCMAVFMPDDYRGEDAERYFHQIVDVYHRQLEIHSGLVEHVGNPRDIPDIMEQNPFALMLTVEGGSALGGKLDRVQVLRDLGVRMMTLTWNGDNEICGGVFSGNGFTEFGRKAVSLMEQAGIVVDVSHLSDKGFYQLCDFATRPFAASHSNSRSICGHRRNLTDDMFGIIRDRGGIVGLNYYKPFISDTGVTSDIRDLIRHVHHFLQLGGEDVIALGSDFDGADTPPYLDDLSNIGNLHWALEQSGIGEAVVQKILYENARRFFAGL